MDKVQMLREYEQQIGKPGTQWGSQEIEGFYWFMNLRGKY